MKEEFEQREEKAVEENMAKDIDINEDAPEESSPSRMEAALDTLQDELKEDELNVLGLMIESGYNLFAHSIFVLGITRKEVEAFESINDLEEDELQEFINDLNEIATQNTYTEEAKELILEKLALILKEDEKHIDIIYKIHDENPAIVFEDIIKKYNEDVSVMEIDEVKERLGLELTACGNETSLRTLSDLIVNGLFSPPSPEQEKLASENVISEERAEMNFFRVNSLVSKLNKTGEFKPLIKDVLEAIVSKL